MEFPSLRTSFSLPTVRHEVALPQHEPGGENKCLDGESAGEKKPARNYPFTLDPFQAISIKCLEKNESVLVSAHTSAGKTVIAEYAIAMALRDKQRVVYTSPIKALSNQKYRELLDSFGDVGLMTGDVTINPTASCLIYRSMLYRGSEVMREVAWVIYDEIHYMRDKERGVVWEETIILTPSSVRFVFLSATIPNAFQFAEWICFLHAQPCHVVYTEMRPTPLQHYIFGAGNEGIHLVLDENKNFREDNLAKAVQKIGDKEHPPNEMRSELQKIIRLVMAKQLHPAIIFSFSRRECEANAVQISTMDFNNDDEKEIISMVFSNAIEALSEEDRSLPQIASLLPLLRRGIALHHSGLLPVLKEVIEILFQENLIKVLFATETFAIGLNMPARTVVFTAIRKFDGQTFRYLSSGEYIQMSGRAGRRGLDDRGVVILMLAERIATEVLRGMMNGIPDALYSAFRLSYNMILNMMRLEGFHPESMVERSFMQFQNRATLPQLTEQLRVAEKSLLVEARQQLSGSLELSTDLRIEAALKLVEMHERLERAKAEVRKKVFDPAVILPFLQPGRLVLVSQPSGIQNWGSVLNCHKTKTKLWVVDLIIDGSECVVPVSLDLLVGVSSIRMVLPGDLRTTAGIAGVGAAIHDLLGQFKNAVPELDPIQDLGLNADPAFSRLLIKRNALEASLIALGVTGQQLEAAHRLAEARAKVVTAERALHSATLVSQMEDLRGRRRALRLLGFTTTSVPDAEFSEHATEIVTVKGRVACEISTGDELVLTELLFAGIFNSLSVEQSLALLSCFICEEKSTVGLESLGKELRDPFLELQNMARQVGKTLRMVFTDFDETEYLESFRPALMEAVSAWVRGAKFSVVCKIADGVFEGSIIRTMRRLEELLRQLCQAAKSIGSTVLEIKFAEGITAIRRDIVFASSLYL